ncbi:MAG: dihydrodipicolinate synthase family protein [Solobacterium sp.]|jgi:N-acetylneuraminate lyase|nr:dihydrodipicolinate synthase family protein [Solobacterium sp.]MCH4222005.1 dihydrodipicolinate synthase family protein [Solobacterium sp.]MCH4266042.1 dihydrodipicolinate synthase family protein [Solobacterium sp.]
MDHTKFEGIIPAFYACYDDEGNLSEERVRGLARYLLNKGVKGVYVGGSSGECIYQSVAERKLVLEAVMKEVGGKLTVIAHVACNNTKDSCELAAHSESLHVDAIASIPPIYFHLPADAVAGYWNDISAAAPHTPFVIYNIPQLAGTALSLPLLKTMKQNPNLLGVKNSSMPVQDIQMWRDEDVFVFNGPDEQLLSGLAAGAGAGIGGTYAAMPELFLAIFKCYHEGDMAKGRLIQNEACRIIYKACSSDCNMYAVLKEVIRIQGGPDCGDVRKPLIGLTECGKKVAQETADMIAAAIRDLL